MTEPLRIVETADGSITCFHAETGELYHNRAGAFAEAYTHFVQPLDLHRMAGERDSIRILDLPFGLGYNSLVLLQELLKMEISHPSAIEIVGVEIDGAVLQLLDKVLQSAQLKLLRECLGASCKEVIEAIGRFEPVTAQIKRMNGGANLGLKLHVRQGDLRQILPPLLFEEKRFDAIMHDAFSPNKMPELWTEDLFALYKKMLLPEGRISTYSVSVGIRAGLLRAGFNVYNTCPLGAKSGGTLASVSALGILKDDVTELSEDEKLRLNGRSGIPYRDNANFNLSRGEIRKRRIDEQEAFGH